MPSTCIYVCLFLFTVESSVTSTLTTLWGFEIHIFLDTMP